MADYSTAKMDYDAHVAREERQRLVKATLFSSDSAEEQLMSPKDRVPMFGTGFEVYFIGKLSWTPVVPGSVVITYPNSTAKHARWKKVVETPESVDVTEGPVLTVTHETGVVKLLFPRWKGPAKGVPLKVSYRYKTGIL